MRHRHHVYVILLDDRVWNEAKFRRANEHYTHAKPPVYVGMTGLTPEIRFARHKSKVKSNRFVFDYGVRLLPQLYAMYNPMPLDAARDMEVELAIGLKQEGYAVWQA